MAQKRIMIVAGGAWQVPLVQTAKEMGLFVINSNPYPDSPAFRYADAHCLCDVLDKEANLAAARQWRPDGVVTDQSDIAVPTVAWLCEQLGLPGIGSEAAALFTNKYKMRAFLRARGLPTPDFCLCETAGDVRAFLRRHEKIVIKPIDSQSSRGVFVLQDEAGLEALFSQALQYSHSAKQVLAEQYVGGTEFTVDGLRDSGGYHTLAISEKRHFAHNPSIASALRFSRENPRVSYEALRALNDRLVPAMGLPFGLTHAEYKYENGTFYLIEIAARGGGTRISSDIVPYLSGVNSNRALLEMALGGETHASPTLRADRFAALRFLDLAPGVVKRIRGAEEIARMPGVLGFGLDIAPGDVIRPPADDRSRPGWYIATGGTPAAVAALEAAVEETLRIEYDG